MTEIEKKALALVNEADELPSPALGGKQTLLQKRMCGVSTSIWGRQLPLTAPYLPPASPASISPREGTCQAEGTSMTEAEALDEAAKAAGWEDYNIALYNDGDVESIRAHAKTIMENAALEAKLADVSKALMATAEAAASSAKKAVEAEAKLSVAREALRIYAGPMEWTQEGGWGVFPVWADGYPGGVYVDDNTLDYGDAARAALKEIEGD